MPIVERACAKVNLSLKVLGRRPDGYHELDSLVAFARDVFDSIELHPSDEVSVDVTGPFAAGIDGENLVQAAAQAVQAIEPALKAGHFIIEKRLPVAAGLGGGSADAAAALRALAHLNGVTDFEERFGALAAQLGADVPVCLGGNGCTAAYMSGIGERVRRPADGALLPGEGVFAVLVNPRVPVPTGGVFARLAAPPLSDERPFSDGPLECFEGLTDLMAYLDGAPNDLQGPACDMVPVIGDVLAELGGLDGCLLSRMSGSGATCFGLFESVSAAEQARDRLRHDHPAWWTEASLLT